MNNALANWKLWVPGVLLLGVMVTGVVGNYRLGNYSAMLVVGFALFAAGLLFFASQFRARLLFRDKTPEGVIAHYHNLVRRIPHADAAAAYLSSIAAAAYGDFARAHQELDAVDWNGKPATYLAQRQYSLAVIALMEDNDAARALALAREGRDLEQNLPGGVQVIFNVVETVAGVADPGSISRVEQTAQRKSGMVPALCLWALALHCGRTGRAAEATQYAARLRTIAPNCRSLVQSKS